MGASGPCGPCTEIHFDHRPGDVKDRAAQVNAGRDDLVEVWNLVFMEYQRNAEGQLSRLPEKVWQALFLVRFNKNLTKFNQETQCQRNSAQLSYL